MVLVELNIDANDDITAAAKAANASPFTTVGVKLWIRNGYASSLRRIAPDKVSRIDSHSGAFMI